MIHDFQKTKVYRWEDTHVISVQETTVPYDQLQGLVDYVWKEEGIEHPPKIKELSAQCTATEASGCRLSIGASKQGMRSTVLMHEIAHSMTSNFEGASVAHGERFVGVYMNLLANHAGHNISVLMHTAKISDVKFNFDGHVL